MAKDLVFERGLPANVDAEKLCLGAALLDGANNFPIISALEHTDFSLHKHQIIFFVMEELHSRGRQIDRVTVANELMMRGQLEAVDGLGYLVSLDDGLPGIYNLHEYVRIVKEHATSRELIHRCQVTIERCLNRESIAEVIKDSREALLELSSSHDRHEGQTFQQLSDTIDGGISALLDPSRRKRGLPTGFTRIDNMGGIRPGEVIVIGGRTSQGKSSLAANIATHISVAQDLPVDIFSLEMSKEQIFTRIMCSMARVDHAKYMLGYLSQDERNQLQDAATRLADSPLYIDDTASLSVNEIAARIHKNINNRGCSLAVIDYLQLLGARSIRKNDTESQVIGQMSRIIKLIAMETKVPFLLLSQLSRPKIPRQYRPSLDDLRMSGQIEENSDQVWLIFRQEVYDRDREDLKGIAELIIAKNRNGPLAVHKLAFMGHFLKFDNLAVAGEDG